MYIDARLPHADNESYKQKFEKEFFQVVNLLRTNPNFFLRFVKQYASSNLCTQPQACLVVESKLKRLGQLQGVELDAQAATACFINLTKNEDSDQFTGGAVSEYKNQTCQREDQPEYEATDFAKKRWSGSPVDLVIDILVNFYSNPANKDATHSILSGDLTSIGSALVKSKKYNQIFQVLFVKRLTTRTSSQQ